MRTGLRQSAAVRSTVAGVGPLVCALCALWISGCLTPEGYTRTPPGTGAAGTSGTAGATGAAGATGKAGTSGTGAAGTTGITGIGGATAGKGGTIGAAGTTGAAGTSGVAGTMGAAGTTGRAGTTGTAGTTGVAGTTGTAGTTGSGGASGTVLFSDDFEGGNTSPWATNAAAGGTAMIGTDGSHVYELSSNMSKVFLSANGSTVWTDQVLQAQIKILSFTGSSSSYFAGLCGRVASGASEFFCVALRSDGKLAIRDVGGAIGTPGSVNSNITTGTWYTVRLEIIGTTINAYLNGALVDTATASIAVGGVGLAVENTDAEFDDVTVTSP